MNKKLLFGLMSLAALASCSTDDFESKSVAEEATSPVKFEVINGNDAITRASWDSENNKVEWSAKDGDLFTLYHGGTTATLKDYENATFKAAATEGKPATLSTPSIIKRGSAIMVWPVDTAFRIRPANKLSIVIPADQSADVENNIPYVSDEITIGAYGAYNEDPLKGPVTAWNTEGKDRKYPVFMRPMASQLNLKTDYLDSYAPLKALEESDDPIDPIKLTSVELLTKNGGADEFTTDIDIKWTAPTAAITAQWAAVANNAWTNVTDFDKTSINVSVDKLTTECLDGNNGCKFLILPQIGIAGGVDEGAIVVNTIYGKVVIGDPAVYDPVVNPGYEKSYYSVAEWNKAWYRYVSAAAAATAEENASTPGTGDFAGKHKVVALDPTLGMQQTINGLSNYIHQKSGVVKGEPEGASTTRYVEVNLKHLDMSDLHITSDKQLYDAVRVWKDMDLTTVTVYLDGDANNEFAISQKTIAKINEINAAAALEATPRNFAVKPCQNPGEICNTIVITGGGEIQDLLFIEDNTGFKANVALNAGENWEWNKDENDEYIVYAPTAGVNRIINRGTMTSAVTDTYKTYNSHAVGDQNNITFQNAEGAKWNITSGTLNVQFTVLNDGTIEISKGAQYRQDGRINGIDTKLVFTNQATAKPGRFGGDDTKIGKVINKGVFATVALGEIVNVGLIEHADKNAKTYITMNQTGGATFSTAFGSGNKMGRINLPFSNKEEDNVSVSAALSQGFVSVTVDGEVTGALDASVVGSKVNYVIVNSGITEIKAVSAQVKYLEINQPNTEIAWNVATTTQYDGLMVLSDVNIKLGTKIAATVTYLGSDMYVGGKFNATALAAEGTDPAFAATNWNGYYGNTASNVPDMYVTY